MKPFQKVIVPLDGSKSSERALGPAVGLAQPAGAVLQLISVADKSGIVELAQGLTEMGIAIVSSGGTARVLSRAGLQVQTVGDVTGSGEMLDGRVKTLHPRIHAGILADRSNAKHLAQLRAEKIAPIDLVVSNLYPFSETLDQKDVTEEEIIELTPAEVQPLNGLRQRHAVGEPLEPFIVKVVNGKGEPLQLIPVEFRLVEGSGRFEIRDGVHVGEACDIHPDAKIQGPALIGDYCHVEAGATIGEYTVLGSNVMVRSDAYLQRTVVHDNAYIAEGVRTRGAVIGPAGASLAERRQLSGGSERNLSCTKFASICSGVPSSPDFTRRISSWIGGSKRFSWPTASLTPLRLQASAARRTMSRMRSVEDRLKLIGHLPVVDVTTGETTTVAAACLPA